MHEILSKLTLDMSKMRPRFDMELLTLKELHALFSFFIGDFINLSLLCEKTLTVSSVSFIVSIETILLICSANQWSGFYILGAPVMKQLKSAYRLNYHKDVLTHFWPVFPFYTPWKLQKTEGSLMFSRGTKWEY